MILAFIHQLNTAQHVLQSATELAAQLQKTFGVLCIEDTNEQVMMRETELKTAFPELLIIVKNSETCSLSEVCDELDASLLFLQLSDNNSKPIRNSLNSCRNLRIPYILFKDSFSKLDLTKVILPIGFLEEELEKAQFASAFGRFCNSEIIMLLANDYGTKAANNAEKMKGLFDKFSFKYSLEKGTKDSFKVEKEAIQVAEKENAGIIIVSASRDYGLDDIIFGPKEFHLLKKSPIPLLIVNPRGDLYALCD